VRRLVVSDNRFGVVGASAVFAALRRNSRLVHLEVSRNEIGDASSRELATALIYNRTLRHLSLAGCGLTTATCRVLARPLQTNGVLRALVLDHNAGVCDAGVQALADSLHYNRSLRQLSLNQCGLTRHALTHVLAALRYNNTVRTIDVRPAGSADQQRPSLSNQLAAAADADGDRSHGNVTSSPTAEELSRVLRANPLLRILA